MRKPILPIVLAALIVLLLVATGVLYQRLDQKSQALVKSTNDYATLQANEQETRARYGQAIDEIAAIQDSLNAIALGNEGAKALETQLQEEKSLTQNRGDKVLARIAVIKAGIERAKGRIQDLDKRLKASGVKVAGLEKMIQNLRATVAEKETQIAQLTERVQTLETQVTGLTTQVQEGQVTIAQQSATLEDNRREMGTIYYTIGTKKELKEAGLVVSKGGLLGIGRTLKPSGQIDDTKFTSMDTDQETVIPIPAEKARVLTDQPVSSYQLQAVGERLELHILDPKAFRTVKHVIIVTA